MRARAVLAPVVLPGKLVLRTCTTVSFTEGVGFVDGHVVRWPAATVGLPTNASWLRKRVDVVTVDAEGEFRVHEGVPSLWSEVPPECPTTQVAVAQVVQPSRVGRAVALVRGLVQKARRAA